MYDENNFSPASVDATQTHISLEYPRVDLITNFPNKIQNITTYLFSFFFFLNEWTSLKEKRRMRNNEKMYDSLK